MLAALDIDRDRSQWVKGYKRTGAFLKLLPQDHARRVWERRVLFMSKLGKDVVVGVLKMKDKDARVMTMATSLSRPNINYPPLLAYTEHEFAAS